jgi:uncharacterized membrane protein
LPAVITVAAALLAALTLRIDEILLADRRATFYLAFGGGVEGARGVLTAIAGSMITVTGVVFSITIVALQLASSQYTPRVLRGFTRDRANQVVLGVFIGTFTYTLLVLRMVRSASDDGEAFVPSISVGVAILLALLSIGFLIYYIHHAARSIQASVIIDRAANDTLGLVRRLFPEPIGEPALERPAPPVPAGAPALITAEGAGYLQTVDADTLFELADTEKLTIRMEPYIGEFVLPGAPLAAVWPPTAVDDAGVGRIRQAFVLGPDRTLQQDIELGLRQLADIAIKALSPGINDPTTAVNCIDRLSEILVTLGNRDAPERARSDDQGRVCFVARETTFCRAVRLSFDQIRHYGRSDPVFMAHWLRTLRRAAALVPPARRAALADQVRAALDTERREIRDPGDLERVLEAGAARADSEPGARPRPGAGCRCGAAARPRARRRRACRPRRCGGRRRR